MEIKQVLNKIIIKTADQLGFSISKTDSVIKNDDYFQKIYALCKPFTMTSIYRMYSLYNAVKYVVTAKIPGDFIECGVWQGGSSMIIALTLIHENATNRKIYLYDTFEGMTTATNQDVLLSNNLSAKVMLRRKKTEGNNVWCYAPLPVVKKNMVSTNYPQKNIIYVKGKVENTIPRTIPRTIALLRLDTDWYSSTKHELVHTYPLLSKNGVLIIDDYGCWAGAKKAVDEYFRYTPILLNRIDETGRIVIKN